MFKLPSIALFAVHGHLSVSMAVNLSIYLLPLMFRIWGNIKIVILIFFSFSIGISIVFHCEISSWISLILLFT